MFPDGIKDWLEFPTFLHARYLSTSNRYLSDPDLAASMICEADPSGGDGICLPVDAKVFSHMMQGVRGWSPFVYEQDWISTTLAKSKSVSNSTTTGTHPYRGLPNVEHIQNVVHWGRATWCWDGCVIVGIAHHDHTPH